jgi:RNA polymerase sigma factor (sigma-70 family)
MMEQAKNTMKHDYSRNTSPEPPDTRESLIARICDTGNSEAWTEFVRIYEPVVLRFIQRHDMQYADAAEVTQEVLSCIAKSIESWDGDRLHSTFRGWLYRITRNRTIDFLRKRRIEQARTAGQEHGLSQFAAKDDTESKEFQAEYEKQLFHWAAEKIKPTFKPVNWQAFWMSTVEGQPIEQVAERLQIECGAVYVARSRIMARLSKLIQERLNETNSSTEYQGKAT